MNANRPPQQLRIRDQAVLGLLLQPSSVEQESILAWSLHFNSSQLKEFYCSLSQLLPHHLLKGKGIRKNSPLPSVFTKNEQRNFK